jgi:lysophospholipase L1-like esterase
MTRIIGTTRLFAFCALLASFGAQAQDSRWVASWGTAQPLAVVTPPSWVQPPPADQRPANPPPSPIPPVPQELNDQTVRMIVRSSVGGDAVRIQLANAQGTEPVRIGAVHVALHGDDSAIDLATDRAVTFGGNANVTLYPGALVISDPIDLAVPALGELAVSVYVPDSTPTTTRHELGLNTTWIVAGNATGAASVAEASGASTNRSYFWLSGVEVLASAPSAAIAAFGDSITDGYATTADAHRAWPALLAERLRSEAPATPFGVLNLGISGNRVLRDNIGVSALARFDRDVLAREGVRWMILLEGINDITWSALPGIPESQQASAGQIIEGLSQLVDRAHAQGINVMGGTLTPMAGLWLFNAETEALRQAVNAWIRDGGKFDAVVDFDAVTRDPADPTRLKPEYDSGDHIHPNDAGNAAMAQAIDLAIFTR